MKTHYCTAPLSSLDLSLRDNVEPPKASHTPGPWRVDDESPRFFVYEDRNNNRPAICGLKGDRAAQDACLIAAAPELLEALKLVYECMIYAPEFSQVYTGADGSSFIPAGKARAAIAKAEGSE